MFVPKWEDKMTALLEDAGITKVYPLIAPLEVSVDGSEGRRGHMVYTHIVDDFYDGYDGSFIDSILVGLDVRSEDYGEARDLLNRVLEALDTPGRRKSQLLVGRETISTEYDVTTRLYRFLVNVSINPYYTPRADTPLGNRSFSSAFSKAFG